MKRTLKQEQREHVDTIQPRMQEKNNVLHVVVDVSCWIEEENNN